METISVYRRNRTQAPIGLYALGVSIAIFGIGIAAAGALTWQKERNESLKRELLEVNWMLFKIDALQEAKRAWLQYPNDFSRKGCSENRIISLISPTEHEIDVLTARVDAAGVRLDAKYGRAESRLAKVSPELSARLYEANPHMRQTVRGAMLQSIFRIEKECEAAYAKENVSCLQIRSLLEKRYSETIDAAVNIAKNDYIEITRLPAKNIH